MVSLFTVCLDSHIWSGGDSERTEIPHLAPQLGSNRVHLRRIWKEPPKTAEHLLGKGPVIVPPTHVTVTYTVMPRKLNEAPVSHMRPLLRADSSGSPDVGMIPNWPSGNSRKEKSSRWRGYRL